MKRSESAAIVWKASRSSGPPTTAILTLMQPMSMPSVAISLRSLRTGATGETPNKGHSNAVGDSTAVYLPDLSLDRLPHLQL